MAVLLSPVGGVAAQFFTNAGVPLSGGKIYTYAAGTSTPQATYTTGAGNIQHSNPIVLDAAGRVPTGEIWLTDGSSYKFVLKDANDVLIATYDNIVGINSNFVNFVNQQEIQTATAGQTVFTLTTMEYQPGTGNLSVFVDGVNQYGPGAQYAYTETSSTVVTFVSGLHVGASVKFTTTEIQNSGVADASQITYTYPDANAVQESVEARLAQYVSVKDFGAVGDGVTSDLDAFNNALAIGGTIYVPQGTYNLDGQVVLATDNTTLLLGSDVTLLVSNVPAVQTPVFGAQIYITGQNCSIIGNGPSSLIQAYNGTYANGICFRGNYGSGLVQNLVLDGAKTETTAQPDDSFGGGIIITGYSTKTAAKVVINNCIIRNWSQYGIDNYNNLGATTVTNCTIHDIGVESQAYSNGTGIINSNGVNDFTATNNSIFNNKLDGISSNSALDASNYLIANNIIYNNTHGNGIVFTQQANYGCVTGKGISNITVTGNTVSDNGDNGIVFSTTVGYLSFITCTGNTCTNNNTYGINASSADTSNRVTDITIVGNVTSGNGIGGIGIGQYVLNWNNSGNIVNDVSQNTTGAFTPVVVGITSAGTATYADQRGTYTKIGNMVFYQINLAWSGHTGTGQMRITGFPIAASSVAPTSAAWAAPNSFTVTGQVFALPIGGQSYANMYAEDNGITGPLAMDASASMLVSGSYVTDL